MTQSLQESQQRLLIVDDNIDAASTLAMLLAYCGFEVATVNDGPSGVVATRTFCPHILLLDIGMPIMNGYEVATVLREDPATRQVVIIGHSAWNDHDTRLREEHAGFDGHLTKPATIDAIRVEIAIATARHAARARSTT